MDFNFTEEQQLLADTVQRFVREDYTFEKRREILKSTEGWSREMWGETCRAWSHCAQRAGGAWRAERGPVDTMLVMNALGEGLVLEPFLGAAVLTPALIARLDDEKAAADLFEGVVSGERIVIVAHQEPTRAASCNHVATRAEKSGDGYVLDGHKSVVAHGGAADEFLVTARTSGKTTDTRRRQRVPRRSESRGRHSEELRNDRRSTRRRHRV